MKRLVRLSFIATALSLAACGQKSSVPKDVAPETTTAAGPKIITSADLSAMADAVPKGGPREGNNYKVFMLVLRSNQAPAAGFRVDMWVKGQNTPVTVVTDPSGLAKWENLPFPDAKHHLNCVLHYFRGKNDDAREIDYPYIEGDAYRLKDTQYIPNTATPDAQ